MVDSWGGLCRRVVRLDYFVLTVITVMTGFTARLVVESLAQLFANRDFVARRLQEFDQFGVSHGVHLEDGQLHDFADLFGA